MGFVVDLGTMNNTLEAMKKRYPWLFQLTTPATPTAPPTVHQSIGHSALDEPPDTNEPTALRPPKKDRPRCGAKTRSGGTCQAPALWVTGQPKPKNGRCRMHGGLSTGPKSREGIARVTANLRKSSPAEPSQRATVGHLQGP